MKGLFNVLVFTLLASVIWLAGCNNQSQRVATSVTKNASIPVVLPTLAEVKLTKGEPKSGRVTKITDKELTIEVSGAADSIAIKDIKQVKFRQEAPLPRGSEPQLRNQSETWRVMPLTAFQMKDSSKGLAEVAPSSVVKEKQSTPDSLGEPTSYVVEEISFDANSPGTMRIKVTGVN